MLIKTGFDLRQMRARELEEMCSFLANGNLLSDEISR